MTHCGFAVGVQGENGIVQFPNIIILGGIGADFESRQVKRPAIEPHHYPVLQSVITPSNDLILRVDHWRGFNFSGVGLAVLFAV